MSFGFGFALPAYPLRGGTGNNPFNQSGPTLDLSFTGVVTNLTDPNGYTLNTNFIIPQYQIAAQYVVWETGVGLVDKTFSQIVTFSRTSGATWFNSAGVNVGIDFSTSSVAIGTGSKTFTLTATAGVDRSWTAGDIVRISEQATPANFMDGTVTSYTASTQTLVVNVTATGGSGTIASWRVSNWMPRLDYNPATLAAQGLLIEEARTNLLTYSEDLTQSAWTTNSVAITTTANQTTAPDGNITADIVVPTAVSSSHILRQFASVTSGTAYSASWFVKAAGYTFCQVTLSTGFDGGGALYRNFNLSTGANGNGDLPASQTTIASVGNGWYRITVTATSTLTTASGRFNLNVLNADTASANPTYTGDGTSGLYIWGAQLEAGAFPTSYIPTTVAQVTRNADQASVNTLSPWYNATEGTLFFEMAEAFVGSTANDAYINFSNGTTNNVIGVFQAGVGATPQMRVIDGGVNQAGPFAGNITANVVFKIANAYKQDDFAMALNGVQTANSTDPSGTVPSVSRLNFNGPTGNTILAKWLRRVTYYPRRLSNAELQAITA